MAKLLFQIRLFTRIFHYSTHSSCNFDMGYVQKMRLEQCYTMMGMNFSTHRLNVELLTKYDWGLKQVFQSKALSMFGEFPKTSILQIAIHFIEQALSTHTNTRPSTNHPRPSPGIPGQSILSILCTKSSSIFVVEGLYHLLVSACLRGCARS